MKVLLLEDTDLVFVYIPDISQKGLLQRKNLVPAHFGFLFFHVVEFICGSSTMPSAT